LLIFLTYELVDICVNVDLNAFHVATLYQHLVIIFIILAMISDVVLGNTHPTNELRHLMRSLLTYQYNHTHGHGSTIYEHIYYDRHVLDNFL
jgi:hypothetical protein